MRDRYPRGKLKDDDMGETAVAIHTQDRTVIIEFPNPTKWIGLDKFGALQLADMIKKQAESITDAS